MASLVLVIATVAGSLWVVGIVTAALTLSALFLFSGWCWWTAPHRIAKWQDGLPFELTGYIEALGRDELVAEATLRITYEDATELPTSETLTALFPSMGHRFFLSITEIRSSRELAFKIFSGSTNGLLYEYVYRFVSKVLLPRLHRAYPIAAVVLEVTSTKPFKEYASSGSD